MDIVGTPPTGLVSVELLQIERDTCDRLRADNERLRAACERMMIGGNHIATYKTERWPHYGSDCWVALERLGAGQEYDMWCCWNAIMCARDTLEPKP